MSQIAQHRQILGIQRGGDRPLQHRGKASITTQHREQIKASRTGILQVVQRILRHHHKVTAAGRDRPSADTEQRLTSQHEEQLGSVVVTVKRHPIRGIVDLQKDRQRRGGIARILTAVHITGGREQRQAAVVVLAEAEAMQLSGMRKAQLHRLIVVAAARMLTLHSQGVIAMAADRNATRQPGWEAEAVGAVGMSGTTTQEQPRGADGSGAAGAAASVAGHGDPADRLILALDRPDSDAALALVAAIPQLRWVKVGLELFSAAGPDVVRQLRGQGLRVFLDLKFHDIPATMAGACRSAARLGAELITVHACAGGEALRAAQEAAQDSAAATGLPAPTLLAVTVLTSWDIARFAAELAITEPIERYVPRLASLAAAAGIGGCVCSPLEVAALRAGHPEPFALVTPGIRPAGVERGDQQRVMTPAQAIRAGASHLVIGRPISGAPDPAAVFAACCAELEPAIHDASASQGRQHELR